MKVPMSTVNNSVQQRINGTVVKAPNDSTEQHAEKVGDSEGGDGENEKEQFGLKRTLGLVGAISFNLGTMIGRPCLKDYHLYSVCRLLGPL